LAAIRAAWAAQGLDEEAIATLSEQWCAGTRKSYDSKIKRFEAFCTKHGTSAVDATPVVVVNFLQECARTVQPATIDTYATAVVAFLTRIAPGWSDPSDLIGQFRRAIGKTNPRPERRSERLPSLRPLFTLLEGNRQAERRDVCRARALVLLKLVTLARAVDMSYWLTASIVVTDTTLRVTAERTKGRSVAHTYEVHRFADKPALCPVAAFEDYWRLLRGLSTDKYVWRAIKRPFGGVSADTISRVVSSTLAEAGIDLRSHGLRASSASTAAAHGVPLDAIQAAGHWSSAETMLEYYIRRPDASDEVQRAIYASMLDLDEEV
jgi:hypothetical protein